MRNVFYLTIRLFCLIVVLLLNSAAYADTAGNLYSATVPLANQTSDGQAAAFQAALNNVLIKTSGNPGIASLPAVAAAIKQAPQWVQSYNYASADNSQIAVQFDPSQINQLLASVQQPAWSGTRPQTLVWLVANNDSQSQLIGSDSKSDLPTLIHDDAAQRGLNVTFPLIDLQDLSVINPQAITQYQPETVRQASTRYVHDDILLASVTSPAASNADWQINWTLLFNGAKLDWQTSAADEKTAIAQGIDQFANNIFTQHQSQASTQTADNNISLTVYGVSSLQAYSMVNQYLQQLSTIQSVSLVTMAADHVVFTITPNASIQALNAALTTGNVLAPADGNNDTSLVFRVNT